MRALVIVPAFVLISLLESNPIAAQIPQVAVASAPIPQRLDVRFRVFPTDNIWTFLLLDTANGLVWQMQYSISDSTSAGRFAVNSQPLIATADAKPGRFTLYATHNMFNFVLLDQENGNAWQIQWSTNAKGRGIVNNLSVELH
jgi:hypothetical protein